MIIYSDKLFYYLYLILMNSLMLLHPSGQNKYILENVNIIQQKMYFL